MASYNGFDLGPTTVFQFRENPVAYQQSVYPGVNGVQMNRLGARGSVVALHGEFIGASAADLQGILLNFIALQRGGALGVLDAGTLGTYVNAMLIDFNPASDIMIAPGVGFAQSYTMQFLFPLGL